MYRRAPNDCLCTFLSPTLLSASGGVKRERKKLKKLPWEWLVFIKERENIKKTNPFTLHCRCKKEKKKKNTAWPLRCLVRHSLAPLPISEFVFFFSFCSFWRADTRCYHLSHFFSLLIVRPTAGRPLEDVLLCPCRFPSRTPRSMLMGDLYIIGLTKRWCQYQISEEGESCAISPSIPLLSVEYGAYCMSGWIRQTSWITRWSSWGPP